MAPIDTRPDPRSRDYLLESRQNDRSDGEPIYTDTRSIQLRDGALEVNLTDVGKRLHNPEKGKAIAVKVYDDCWSILPDEHLGDHEPEGVPVYETTRKVQMRHQHPEVNLTRFGVKWHDVEPQQEIEVEVYPTGWLIHPPADEDERARSRSATERGH